MFTMNTKIIAVAFFFMSHSTGYEILQRGREEWKVVHDKRFDYGEEVKRQHIWQQNLKKVIDHNMEADQGLHTYRLGMNQFSDMDNFEWTELTRGKIQTAIGNKVCNSTGKFNQFRAAPDDWDWRKQGAVTPVKNQGQLGASWTFSATGALEGQHFIKTENLVDLSERNLADCATPEFSHYCDVGNMDCAFYYVIKNNGIDTEEGYPGPPNLDGKCYYTVQARGATCSGCVDLPSGDEHALERAVANVGPISAMIQAHHSSFHLYTSGIYFEEACRSDPAVLDHAVLVVGYGTEDGDEYWIVKNSWGISWGEEGYIRMSRNRGNNCGIASRASYPVT